MFEFLSYSFGIRALIGGLAVAFACSILGVFLVLRRLSLIADGLGHVAFGGIALGFYLNIYPIYTAMASVIVGAFGISYIKQFNVYSDAAIGIFESIGLAVGVVIVSLALSQPSTLFSYLFGTILGLSNNDVLLALILSSVVGISLFALWKELISITVDNDFSRVAGLPVDSLEFVFTLLTGITVVLAVKLIGVLLVSSMIIIPASAAIQLKREIKQTFLFSILFALLSVIIGLQLSFSYNLAPGGIIVLVSIIFLLLSVVVNRLKPNTQKSFSISSWKHSD